MTATICFFSGCDQNSPRRPGPNNEGAEEGKGVSKNFVLLFLGGEAVTNVMVRQSILLIYWCYLTD